MNRYRAAWSSYVSAWWMKLIVVASLGLFGVGALIVASTNHDRVAAVPANRIEVCGQGFLIHRAGVEPERSYVFPRPPLESRLANEAIVETTVPISNAPSLPSITTLITNDAWWIDQSSESSAVSQPISEWAPSLTSLWLTGDLSATSLAALANDAKTHPRLRSIYTNSEQDRIQLAKLLPKFVIGSATIDAPQLGVLGGVSFVVMCLATLIVAQIASQLALSSHTLTPRFAETHAVVALSAIGSVILFGTVLLLIARVDASAAIGVSLVAGLIPAAFLDFDRKRQQAGTCILPASMMPIALSFAASSVLNRPDWWHSTNEFLAGRNVTASIACLLVSAVLARIFWNATQKYARSLAENDRHSAVVANKADMRQAFRAADRDSWWSRHAGVHANEATKAVKAGLLASPQTPSGRRDLLNAGLFHLSPVRIAVGTVLLTVFAFILVQEPVILLFVPIGAVFGTLLGLPVVKWIDRSTRLAGEIGSLMPRREYVDALRAAIRHALRKPLWVLTIIAAIWSIAVAVTQGEWWLLPLALALCLSVAVTCISALELALTLSAQWARAVVCMGPVYICFLAAFGTLAALGEGKSGILTVVCIVACAAIPIAMRSWSRRRLANFEFGTLA